MLLLPHNIIMSCPVVIVIFARMLVLTKQLLLPHNKVWAKVSIPGYYSWLVFYQGYKKIGNAVPAVLRKVFTQDWAKSQFLNTLKS